MNLQRREALKAGGGLGLFGLLAAAAITFAVVYLVRQRRTQPVKG